MAENESKTYDPFILQKNNSHIINPLKPLRTAFECFMDFTIDI